ncbi:unnamed protein product [Notodromas monacha]|uniref:Uncharacterized protein n=1 Tax=Notodromas monacha TaxID=399045 RepID=A0A7R9GD84_9CRUS|nr:unnamed protein product [Notodromas monacha]CAG0918279.1 unnamed protein product [Notodromas monacha]
MEKETRRIEVLVDEVQQDLTSGTVPEETCGCLRAAVGKARLLRDQKFAQFRSLCDKNLKPSESEEKVLAGDLAGFWDLVWIQIDEINRTFAEIQELKSNNWQTRPEPESLQGHHHGFSETDTLLPLSSSATTAAGASNNSSSRPAKKANNNKTGEAASKRIQRQERASLSTASAAAGVSDVADERRKRMLEFKRKMKKAHHQLEEENGGQEVADIVFFEGLSDKQKLRT